MSHQPKLDGVFLCLGSRQEKAAGGTAEGWVFKEVSPIPWDRLASPEWEKGFLKHAQDLNQINVNSFSGAQEASGNHGRSLKESISGGTLFLTMVRQTRQLWGPNQ